MVVTTNHASASSKQHGESHMSRTVAFDFIRALFSWRNKLISNKLINSAICANEPYLRKMTLSPIARIKLFCADKAIFHVGIVRLRG